MFSLYFKNEIFSLSLLLESGFGSPLLLVSIFPFSKVSKIQPQIAYEPRHEVAYEQRHELAYEPRHEDINDRRHIQLPIPQDNTLCDNKSGGGGIVQLFIENGGITS